MKIVTTVSFLAAITFASAALAKEATESLKYTGWHCAGCASKVEKAVKGVDGVKTTRVTKDTITVTYDDEKATHSKIKDAIASAGKYEVKDVEPAK